VEYDENLLLRGEILAEMTREKRRSDTEEGDTSGIHKRMMVLKLKYLELLMDKAKVEDVIV
jgi:hypothetical protein